jgi:hypothetical protein
MLSWTGSSGNQAMVFMRSGTSICTTREETWAVGIVTLGHLELASFYSICEGSEMKQNSPRECLTCTTHVNLVREVRVEWDLRHKMNSSV